MRDTLFEKPQPLYQRVKNHILDLIGSGSLKAEDKVPSESELVRTLGVSRMTANRALRELAAEGHLVGVAGVGRFVAGTGSRGELLEIRNIAEEIRGRQHTYRAEVLKKEEVSADEEVAAALHLAPGSQLFHSRILHWEADAPLQIEDRYVNPRVAPQYLTVDFTQQTPHEHLMAAAPLQEAEHLVQAVLPDADTHRLLQMQEGEPCLLMIRRTWSAGMAASFAKLYHPGSRYVLGGRFAHPHWPSRPLPENKNKR